LIEVYTDGGREKTGKNAIAWTQEAVDLGVGEILITSIDQDGRRRGYDMDLAKVVTSLVPVPVIVHGGAINPESIQEVIKNTNIDAVAASSIFHYNEFSIKSVKEYLYDSGINIRLDCYGQKS